MAELLVNPSRIVARLASGDLKAATVAELLTLLNVEAAADVTDAANVNTAGAVMETDFAANTLRFKNNASTMGNIVLAASQILGRKATGDIDNLTATEIRTIINVENGSTADQTDAEIKTAYENNANSNEYSDSEQTTVLSVENNADVTDATNVNAAGAVMETDFAANTIRFKNNASAMANLVVAANSVLMRQAAEIIAIAIAASQFIGRASAGNVRNLTATEARTILNVENNADVTDATNVNAAGAVMESDFANNSVQVKNNAGAMLNIVFAASQILGRASSGDLNNLTPTNVRSIINVEDNADVTDTANVTSAGALMDSEVDADLKTLVLPASTTISTFGASLIDDSAAVNGRATLGVVIGTDVLPEISLVTQAEAQAGSATTERIWSALRVREAHEASPSFVQIQVTQNADDVLTGTGIALVHIPFARKLTAVHAEVATAGTTGVSTFDINRNGITMLSTKLTIDSAETGSDTAATAAVIDTGQDDTAINDVITIDVDGVSTTKPKGLTITMTFENS